MKVLKVTEDPPMLHVLALGKEQTIKAPTMERAIQAARKAGNYFESIEEVEQQIKQVLIEQSWQEPQNVNVETEPDCTSSVYQLLSLG